jgi:hypothetical protein
MVGIEGISENYCSICGGPSGDITDWKIDDFLNYLEDIIGEKKFEEKEYSRLYHKLKFKGNWLNNFGAVLESGKYVPSKYAEKNQDALVFSNYTAIFPPSWDFMHELDYKNPKEAFLVHGLCYKLFTLKTKQNIFDLMKSLTHLINSRKRRAKKYSEFLSGINYGPIRKYTEQFFDWIELAMNPKDIYVIENPSKNKENCKRILGIIQQIMKKSSSKGKSTKQSPSKSRASRPSPSESATKFRVGTKKKGNDRNMWIIKENKNGTKRWVKV